MIIPNAPRLAAAFTALALLAASPAGANGFERDVLAGINEARTDPRGFAALLRSLRDRYGPDRSYVLPSNDALIMTREGVSALDEAVRFLERQQPLPPLDESDLLARAAGDHSDEQGRSGSTGHYSRNGGSPGDRVMARGGQRYVAETISYGQGDPTDVVIQLIVDDGVADRGHRKVIFDPALRFAGAGCGRHSVYQNMCTIDYARTETGAFR
jgi:hypothetical protein